MRAVPDEAHETVRGEPERRLGDGSCSLLSQVRPRESRAASWRTPVARCERGQLAEHVAHEIGRFARPDAIRFADALPKTRSGKIMRRLLKEIASGTESKGDVTTLEDLSVLAALRATDEE